MPTRVLLLRHGESADPTVFHGAESDIGLSPRGERQAVTVAPLLAAYAPDVVVSSAMRRARDTARPIATTCGVPHLIEPDLHERRVGALSGTPFAQADGVWPETLRRWVAGETWYAPDGAESFDDIRARVLPAWDRLVSRYRERCLVVVAHGVVCKVLFFSLLPELSVADWHRIGPVKNAAISELICDGVRWWAVRLNELPEAVGTV